MKGLATRLTLAALFLSLPLLVGTVLAQTTNQAVRITNGPRVEAVGDNWAVIAWTTSTGGSSLIHYGTNPNALNETAQAPYSDNQSTQAQNHRVRVQNLQPNTTYYFVADSGQGEGTGTEAKSPVEQFRTRSNGQPASAMGAMGQEGSEAGGAGRSQALQITNGPRVEGVGNNWAEIAWTTNTGGSSVIRYGTSPNSLSQTAQAPYADNESTQAQNHRVRLSNLQPNTTYYFVVDSGQGEGTGTATQSTISQFKTK